MKHAQLFYLLIAISFSCSSKNNHDEAIKIYNEAMRIHDEVMPRMDDLFLLRQALNHKIDSMKADSMSNIIPMEELRTSIHDLQVADKAMMDWMHSTQAVPGSDNEGEHMHHNESHPSEVSSEEEIIKVQKDQLASIKKIQEDTNESIKKAKQLLSIK